MRTPPPISTSSPRAHGDAAAPGEPDGERDGRRVVVRDERVLCARQRDQLLLGGAEASAAAARLTVELEQRGSSLAASAAAATRPRGQGARPRFVWRITPVALIDHERLDKGSLAGGEPVLDLVAERFHRLRRLAVPQPRALDTDDLTRCVSHDCGVDAPIEAFANDRQHAARRSGAAGCRASPSSSLAGAHGSRTHRATPSAAPLVLKTRGAHRAPTAPSSMVAASSGRRAHAISRGARHASRMRQRMVLVSIKTIHTVAFGVIAGSILLVLIDGFRGRPTRRTSAALAVSLAEVGVFVGNGFVCPLTPLAERYGARRGSVTDIFLPDVVARNLTWSSSIVLAVGIVLNVRVLWRHGRARYTR